MMGNRRKKIEIENYKRRKPQKLLLNYSDENYKMVNATIENTFEEAMMKCYNDFTAITTPLLSCSQIDYLVSLYKTCLPEHYECSMIMLGYNKKVNMHKNKHLIESGYYDRIVFYQYLSQGQVRYNHLFTFWGMATTASAYANGLTRNDHNSFFGNSTSFNTFMRNTKEWRESMNEAIYIRVKNVYETDS